MLTPAAKGERRQRVTQRAKYSENADTYAKHEKRAVRTTRRAYKRTWSVSAEACRVQEVKRGRSRYVLSPQALPGFSTRPLPEPIKTGGYRQLLPSGTHPRISTVLHRRLRCSGEESGDERTIHKPVDSTILTTEWIYQRDLYEDFPLSAVTHLTCCSAVF